MTPEHAFGLLQGCRVVVFDLDDTLYLQRDFKLSGFTAVALWLEANGYADRRESLAALHAILDAYGPSYPRMFDRLVERLALHATLVRELVGVFTRHVPDIRLFPGARALLLALRPHFLLGILTDGREQVQRAKVRALELEPLVDALVYSDHLGQSKPEPGLYAWFEEHFQTPGQACVYVGDNPTKDFIGAHQRNWRTIRVLTGEFASIQVPAHYNAQNTIARVTDLHQP